MIEQAQRMSCGNCGKQKHYVYQVPGGLVIECAACKATTEICARASLRVEMSDDSPGGLCILANPVAD